MNPDREEPMVQAAYKRVAGKIRDAIAAGEYPPGAALPSGKEIATEHGITQETALKALRLLANEGHVTIFSRRGAYVRQRPNVRTIVRDRNAYRDEVGYYFDRGAKAWKSIGKPYRGFAVPPAHIADLLGVPHGEDVVVRDRAMGPADSKQALQLATSYIPMSLAAEIPPLRAENTGPGGIYDRIEEHFGAAIEWRETISSRLPDEEEQNRLGLPPTVPLLVVTRESRVRSGDEEVIAEVNETRMAAEQFAVSYAIERDATAAWPREERP
ncbi:GntR family transcriptional regulator [Streptomyces sparsogenes]|uniref:GntR family transcriptional regulator n=1 Tax=Streptomyces sparsogenes TaxID=67365 RepID=UPI0033F6183C